jgi:hypothetical protein
MSDDEDSGISGACSSVIGLPIAIAMVVIGSQVTVDNQLFFLFISTKLHPGGMRCRDLGSMLRSQFSAISPNFRPKNEGFFFLKTNVVINFFHTIAVFGVINDNVFANFFGKNIF